MVPMQIQFSNVLRCLLGFSKNPNWMKCLVVSDSWCHRACQHLQVLRCPWNWVFHSLPQKTFLGLVGNLRGTGNGKICLCRADSLFVFLAVPGSLSTYSHSHAGAAKSSQEDCLSMDHSKGAQAPPGLWALQPSLCPCLWGLEFYSLHKCPITVGFVHTPEEEVRSGWFFPSF